MLTLALSQCCTSSLLCLVVNGYVSYTYSIAKDWVTCSTVFKSESVLYYFFKMRGIDLCEIFCGVNLDQYDKAIGESLTKLAFDAVEKIINVSSITFT